MRFEEVPIKEITSRAQVYRIAAEVIAADMRDEQYIGYRIGVCAAFGRINDAVYQAHIDGRISTNKMGRLQQKVSAARTEFRDLFHDDGARACRDYTYWMGTRNNLGQKRRISALLSAAERLQ